MGKTKMMQCRGMNAEWGGVGGRRIYDKLSRDRLVNEALLDTASNLRMNSTHYDLLIIGTGPGGEGAAMQAVKHGKQVAAVERFEKIGGGCTHWATIPSKALRYAISQVLEVRHNPLFRDAAAALHTSFPDLRRSARSVIDRQVDMRRGSTNATACKSCTAESLSQSAHRRSRSIQRRQASGHGRRVCDCGGQHPYHPPDVDFKHPHFR